MAILGARQSGKTTLAKMVMDKHKKHFLYLDLELPSHAQRLLHDAEQYLKSHADKLIIIDDLKTKNNYVIVPIGEAFPLKKNVLCYSLPEFLKKFLPSC